METVQPATVKSWVHRVDESVQPRFSHGHIVVIVETVQDQDRAGETVTLLYLDNNIQVLVLQDPQHRLKFRDSVVNCVNCDTPGAVVRKSQILSFQHEHSQK